MQKGEGIQKKRTDRRIGEGMKLRETVTTKIVMCGRAGVSHTIFLSDKTAGQRVYGTTSNTRVAFLHLRLNCLA